MPVGVYSPPPGPAGPGAGPNTSGATALGGTPPPANTGAAPIPEVNPPGAITSVSLDPSVASRQLVGGEPVGGTAGTKAQPGRQFSDEELVGELATYLKVKAGKGQTLDAAVADELATKYGVPIETQGTGQNQGGAGSLRHNIASWFNDALRTGGAAVNAVNAKTRLPGEPSPKAPGQSLDLGQQPMTREQALKIRSPKLRQQALAKLDRQPPATEQNQTQSDVSGMLAEVSKKLGVKLGKGESDVAGIAKAVGNLPTAAGPTQAIPGLSGSTQTAGQAWVAFQKQAFVGGTPNGALTAAGKTAATTLENSGYLDKNANNASPTGAQVAQAYSQLLTDSVNNNVSVAQQAQNKAAQAQGPNTPTSEMEAFTNGVATEFGVYLTPQQTAAIANEFGSSALTAADPSSVEDEIKNAVLQFYDPSNPNNPDGVANTMYVDIQQAAQEYAIPISQASLGQMVKTALSSATVESMYVAADSATNAAIEQFQKQAAGLYPTLAPQIAAGYKVADLVAPYNQITSEYTGVPASTIMNAQTSGGQNKYDAFLQGGSDPKTGSPTMMTMDQWRQKLMQDPQYGFQNTQGGKNMGSQLASAIANEFGIVNTGPGQSNPFGQFSPSSALSVNSSGSS